METENLENLEDVDQDDDSGNDLVKKLRKQLDVSNKKTKELEAQNQKILKDSVLASSNLELNDSQKVALQAAHGDKDFTVEALRQTAQELGFIKDVGVEISADEAAALGRVSDAGAGANSAPDPDADFNSELQRIIEQGTQEEMLAYLHKTGWDEQVPARWKRTQG